MVQEEKGEVVRVTRKGEGVTVSRQQREERMEREQEVVSGVEAIVMLGDEGGRAAHRQGDTPPLSLSNDTAGRRADGAQRQDVRCGPVGPLDPLFPVHPLHHHPPFFLTSTLATGRRRSPLHITSAVRLQPS